MGKISVERHWGLFNVTKPFPAVFSIEATGESIIDIFVYRQEFYILVR